jgi:hypothetical protein
MNDAPMRSSHIAARYDRTSSCAGGIVNKTLLPGPIREAHMACWSAIGHVLTGLTLRLDIALDRLSAASPVVSAVYHCTYLYPTWSPACRR